MENHSHSDEEYDRRVVCVLQHLKKGVAVGLFNNMYVKTSTETKQSPTFLKEENLYKGN